jgi:hypothetical protein
MSDTVSHPSHYTAHPSGVEAIEVCEHLSFNLGCALKYVWRAGLKGDALEDLRKAEWYLRRELQRLDDGCDYDLSLWSHRWAPVAESASVMDDAFLGEFLRALLKGGYAKRTTDNVVHGLVLRVVREIERVSNAMATSSGEGAAVLGLRDGSCGAESEVSVMANGTVSAPEAE